MNLFFFNYSISKTPELLITNLILIHLLSFLCSNLENQEYLLSYGHGRRSNNAIFRNILLFSPISRMQRGQPFFPDSTFRKSVFPSARRISGNNGETGVFGFQGVEQGLFFRRTRKLLNQPIYISCIRPGRFIPMGAVYHDALMNVTRSFNAAFSNGSCVL